MAKEGGKKVVLKVGNGATPTEVFAPLQGQKNAEFSGSAASIDVSDKTTNNWGSTLPGTLNAQVTVSGYPVWPDTTGWDALRAAWQAGTPVNCHLVMNAAGDYWSGAFNITGFNVGGANDGATEYSITLANYGALTWTAV